MPDKDPLRLLSLLAIFSVAVANNVVAFFYGHHFIPEIHKLLASGEWVLVLVSYIGTPIFIAFRAWSAPSGSAVFPISLLTSLVAGIWLCIYILAGGGRENNLYLFIVVLVFWLGAIFCLFPKWSSYR